MSLVPLVTAPPGGHRQREFQSVGAQSTHWWIPWVLPHGCSSRGRMCRLVAKNVVSTLVALHHAPRCRCIQVMDSMLESDPQAPLPTFLPFGVGASTFLRSHFLPITPSESLPVEALPPHLSAGSPSFPPSFFPSFFTS